MIKPFLLLSFLFLLLSARENPFFPSDEDAAISTTSNQKINIPALKLATFKLPSSARVIQSITIEYKNLDGSLSQQIEILQNSIDWHLPLFLSQTYRADNLISQKKKIQKFKKIISLDFISLYQKEKELKIITKDIMIRNFLLTQPHRIVCDFKRDINMRSFSTKIPSKDGVVTMIKIGNHNGYYRVVIELDGYYSYELEKNSSTYFLKFL